MQQVLNKEPINSSVEISKKVQKGEVILKVQDLYKSYNRGTPVLQDIQMELKQGEFISIIGPSGAGKSTFLRCINRMIDPTSGSIVFDNTEMTSLKKADLRKQRSKIGMVFQHYNLVSRLSVFENVLHGRFGYKSTLQGVFSLFSEEEKELALSILDKLGMKEFAYKRCDQLSGGQKQRVGIARALVQQPKLLLCDEPIASLDPNASKIIMDHLKDISETMGITVLVNLHQVDVALKYSDRVIGLNKGRIVYDGVPEKLSNSAIRDIYGSEIEDLILE
ncbi:phosphonate ABC transporter ATP-binding protein [Ureibacillus sp. Re31]|uniref:Phosphonate ABC transporter ATP-binding protein n=1 Tax=Ureibacillus galli TaxID=2762222 RepID=A0ABR8XCP9_9BACL|nr:phosphonate ABC transporter ATP-binding protein [Ureibacillus galli]MBD8026976.1 phosphonate ABC transporter ATP-binding protein [Ureibacillus galli]